MNGRRVGRHRHRAGSADAPAAGVGVDYAWRGREALAPRGLGRVNPAQVLADRAVAGGSMLAIAFLSAALVALLRACVWAWRDARAAERAEAGEP